MKIQRLDEMYVNIPIDDEDTEDFESYVAEDIYVPDSKIRNYIDTKYNANDLIDIARQFDPDIKDTDLNAAYDIIIDEYVYNDNDPTGSSDLDVLYEYLDDCIYKDYYDDALDDYYEAKEEEQARKDWEKANRYEF